MSSSRSSGMCGLLQLFEQPNGQPPKNLRLLAVAGGGGRAGVGGEADRHAQRDAAEEGDVHHPRRRLGAARAERIAELAAMGAFEFVGHGRSMAIVPPALARPREFSAPSNDLATCTPLSLVPCRHCPGAPN